MIVTGSTMNGCSEDRFISTKPRSEVIAAHGPNDILEITDSLVRPVLYTHIPDLSKIQRQKAKQKFIDAILPSILVVRHEIEQEKTHVEWIKNSEAWSTKDSTYIDSMQVALNASSIDDLILRLQVHPNSITLVQAAVESGWGTSRFFKEANNVFGIWSYDADEPRISAQNQNVFLRKYDDLSGSIEDYYFTLARARPYDKFRKARANTDSVELLLPYLKAYSSRGMAYVNQLKNIIRQNNLKRYDRYRIDPKHIVQND